MAETLHVRGTVLPEGEVRDVYVVAGRVAESPVGDANTVARDVWIVPGLVDAHCHVGLGPDGAVDFAEQERQALADRDAGTLLMRDCGSAADTRWIDGRPDLPRIIRAGRHLARPRRYLRDVGLEIEPDALPDAVSGQARLGDGWVKLVGDWIDRDTGDLAPCWPASALRAAVARAHDAGARVTVHIFGEEGIDDLLDAGVDCIEHGPALCDAQLDRMAAAGVALVPTLINIATFPSIADRATRFPTYASHMRALHERAGSLVRRAREAGVALYAGTDAGGGITHGRIADEIAALAEAGLGATDAVASASWAAREWLQAGSGVQPGDDADFVAYPADPRADVRAVRHPRLAVLRGRVVLDRR